MKTLIHRIALFAAFAVAARAGNISIVFDMPNQTGFPGDTLHFFGTITNTDTVQGDAPIFLNQDSFAFNLSDTTIGDNFFAAYYPVSLSEGASSGDIDLFDIVLANPETQPFVVYPGTYGLIGGMDGGANTASDNLGQADFSVDVAPEPAMALPILLCLGVAAAIRRRRAYGTSGD